MRRERSFLEKLPGRYSGDDEAAGNVFDDGRTRSHERARADGNALANGCSGADEGQFPDANAAGEARAGREMHVVAEFAIVLDHGCGIDITLIPRRARALTTAPARI